MHHIVICGLPHSASFFQGGVADIIEHKVCVSILSATFTETFFILRRIERERERFIKKYVVVHVQYLVF